MTILRKTAHLLLRLDHRLTRLTKKPSDSQNCGPYRSPGRSYDRSPDRSPDRPSGAVRPVKGRPGVFSLQGREIVIMDNHFKALLIRPGETIYPPARTSWYLLGWATADQESDQEGDQGIVRLIHADRNATILQEPVCNLDSHRKLLAHVKAQTGISGEDMIDVYSKLGHGFGAIPKEARQIIRSGQHLRLDFEANSPLAVELFVIVTNPTGQQG